MLTSVRLRLRLRRLAGHLLTGPIAFGLSGLVDLLSVARLLFRYALSRRPGAGPTP